MSCLDDSTVLRFVSGQLDEIARGRVEDEIGRCRHCAALVAELLRGSSPGVAGREETQDAGDADGADRASPSRYVLGPVIARGGMGTVLAAFDRRLNRSIAIKHIERDEPVLAARFEREIRVTASLQHPGIVPIYDAGVLPDGRPFYAMRHVPGASLERAMTECDSEAKRLGLLVSVLAAADAVAYAHERGITHRDLKPANILVGPFGETVVIDWGLAAIDDGALIEVAGPGAGDDPLTTRLGSVLGTPRYMAPEQARGEPATHQSDVYALGAILYHTLSGAPPVSGDGVTMVLERVARAEVPPLREVAPGLPGDLVAIVERSMASDPAARYASAAELAADLRRYQTGQLVAAHRYSRRDLVRRFLRRHRASVVFAALLATVLTVGGTLSVRGVLREREHAEAEQIRAERERGGAEDLVQFLLHELRARLATVGRLDILSGVADRVEAYYMTTVAWRAELPDALRGRAELYDLRAAVAAAAGEATTADGYIERGLALLDRAPNAPGANEARADLLASKALRSARTGNFEASRAQYLDAVALYRKSAAITPEQQRMRDINVAAKLSNAATMADRLGKPGDAEREWNEAVHLLEPLRARAPDDFDVAKRLGDVRMWVGQSRYRRGQLDTADTALRAAIADGDRLAAREPKNTEVQYLLEWSLIALADVRIKQANFDDAQTLRERALGVAEAMLAIEPASATWQASRARAESDLGSVALEKTQWAIAARRFQSARVAYEQLVTRDPTSREHRRAAAINLAQLALAETSFGRFDAARSAWRASIEHLAQLAHANSPEARLEWAYGLCGYAELERKHGTMAAATTAIERAVALVDGTPDEDHERPGFTYYRAAVLAEQANQRARLGPRRDAIAIWQRAAAMLRGVAARGKMAADWSKKLEEVEQALGERASPAVRPRSRT